MTKEELSQKIWSVYVELFNFKTDVKSYDLDSSIRIKLIKRYEDVLNSLLLFVGTLNEG